MFNEQHAMWARQQVMAMQLAAASLQHQQQQYQQMMFGNGPINNNMLPGPMDRMTRNEEINTQEDSDSNASTDEDDEKHRTLFVANIDDRITEELLYEVFLQAGPIESVRIPKDPSGRPRTFAFVTYEHKCTPAYAMQLYQGLALFNRTLTIKFQGSTSVPTSPQLQRCRQKRPGPPIDDDGEELPRKRRSYDNSALRNSSYPAFSDLQMSPSCSGAANPFNEPAAPDWTKGRGSRRDTPYDRHRGGDGGRKRESDRAHHRRQQNHHHNNSSSNRRSEQRHKHRR